jgi:hypothetical protein
MLVCEECLPELQRSLNKGMNAPYDMGSVDISNATPEELGKKVV